MDKDHIENDSESLSVSERRERRKRRRQKRDEGERGSEITERKATKTRSRQQALQERRKQSQILGENLPIIGGLVTYLKGVNSEIQKVTWPTPEEARRLTIIVISVTVAVSITLGLIDVFYGWWFQEGVQDTVTFLAVGIPVVAIFWSLSWYYILRQEP